MTEFKVGNATITDVANKAGVSKKTVSRVINSEPNVRPETRDRVKQVMSELNYYPNLSARSLASKRSYLVAMLYLTSDDFRFQPLQNGLINQLAKRNYSLLMQPCSGSLETMLAAVEHRTRYMNVDGFILVPPLDGMVPFEYLLNRLVKPFVRITVSAETQHANDIACDDEQAVYELTSELITQGHKAIAFVRGAPEYIYSARRFDGFKRALLQCNVESDPQLVIGGDNSYISGVTAAQQLLALKNAPTAIVCSNDEMAAGVLACAHDLGINVSRDLAIAGFGGSSLASQIWPAITTVKQPSDLMAEIAANKLIDIIEGVEDAVYPQNLPCEIITPKSSSRHKNQATTKDEKITELEFA